jgi:hypothetical protein
LKHIRINHRNHDRNTGLHSPAHLMQNYSTPMAGRLCRAVKSGSGFTFNHRNQFGLPSIFH